MPESHELKTAFVKVVLVTHNYGGQCYEQSQIDGIIGQDGLVEQLIIPPNWRLPKLESVDAVVICVRFRELLLNGIDWNGFEGLRVLQDQDSFMDFAGWHGSSPYEGRWLWALREFNFDALICTGEKSVNHFREAGIKAEVIYKGFDENLFFSELHDRQGICHYGNAYDARKAMLRTLERSGTEVVPVASTYERLNSELNKHAVCLICNMTSQYQLGRLGSSIERIRPGSLLRLQEAPEPMIKNFEAAAAGCCVFMDQVSDLDLLGFEDGWNCVLYSTFDELGAKLDFYKSEPGLVAEIGCRAESMVHERHSWRHRGQDFRRVISEWLDQ